jgi:nitrite reductase/ring-hydroxylating ferredoxin subunit
MLVEVAKTIELAPGGVKAVNVNEKEILLCNYDGNVYAVDRRCGHMNAPLDFGTLEGRYLTCPMHSVQFDITTGEALNLPLYHYSGVETEDKPRTKIIDNYPEHMDALFSHIKICNIRTYPVKVEGDSIKIDI